MKIKKRIISLSLLCVFSLIVFFGCASNLSVKRVRKNLSTYAITATLHTEEKKIVAEENLKYINNTGETLNTLCFHLYPTAFSSDANVKPYSYSKLESCYYGEVSYGDIIIKDVNFEKSAAEYNIIGADNDILEVKLNEPLESKDNININIKFELIVPNCAHRFGYGENNINLGNWYPIVCMYENGSYIMDSYYANGDPFFSDVANYEINFTYPSEYECVTSGVIKNQEDNNEGVTTKTFVADAVRDFALCLVSGYNKASDEIDGININVYSKADDDSFDILLQTSIKSVSLFNKLFGSYPYKILNVVFTDFFQGGMEYPGLVYISTSVEKLLEKKKVIVHEIAHQWWYGIVGNNEVSDAWFDEGLAEYSTLLYFEHYPSEGVDRAKLIEDAKINLDLYKDVMGSLGIKMNQSMLLKVNEYNSEYEYVYMIYVKGLLFFDNLRIVMGDEAFFKFLNSLYKEFKFKIITKEDFISLANKISGVDMTKCIEEFLNGKVDVSQN